MANYSVKSVDEYISQTPEIAHAHLREIRAAVKSALPKTEETISYGKPYYKQPKHLVGFDVYTNHINFEIYVGQLEASDRMALEEKGYKTGNKSFQIRYDQKVPTALLKKIAKAQLDRQQSRIA